MIDMALMPWGCGVWPACEWRHLLFFVTSPIPLSKKTRGKVADDSLDVRLRCSLADYRAFILSSLSKGSR